MAEQQFSINSTFFTDPSNLTQSEAQAFGPKGANDQEKSQRFRVSSGFSAANKPAYAICKGHVFLQPQEGSTTKVNLILRPFTQPSKQLPVRYFVYRGINKNTIFTGATNNEELIADSPTTNSDLVKTIWKNFKDFNEGQTITSILGKWIGYSPAVQQGTDLIDSYYFKQSPDNLENEENPEKQFELPLIPEGASLGVFSNDFSLEIVLEQQDFLDNGFKYDLNYLRAASWEFNTNNVPDGIEEKAFRENILDFVDPAAFFGLHAQYACELTVKTGGTTQNLSGEPVFTQTIDSFYTKHNVYLQIHSEFNRSYDYFENYRHPEISNCSIRLKLGTSSSVDKHFTTYSWPILIAEAFTSNSIEDHTVSMQLITDRDVQTIGYPMVGNSLETGLNGFLRGKFILDGASHFTKNIQFVIPSVDQNGSRISVSCLLKFLFVGKNSLEISLDNSSEEYRLSQYDNLFGINLSTSNFELDTTLTNVSISSSKERLKTLVGSNQKEIGSMTYTTSLHLDHVNDLNESQEPQERVLIEVFRKNIGLEKDFSGDTPSKETRSNWSEFEKFNAEKNNFYSLQPPIISRSVPVTLTNNTINVISDFTNTGENSLKFCLGLSKEEFDQFTIEAQEQSLINVFFGFENLGGAGFYPESNNRLYQVYRLFLIGETNNGFIQKFYPENPTIVYTLNGRFFNSEAYGKNIPSNVYDAIFNQNGSVNGNIAFEPEFPNEPGRASEAIVLLKRDYEKDEPELVAVKKDPSVISEIQYSKYGVVERFKFLNKTYVSTVFSSRSSSSCYYNFAGYIEETELEKIISGDKTGIQNLEKIVFGNYPSLSPAEQGDFIDQDYVDESGLWRQRLKWNYDGTKATPPYTETNFLRPIPVSNGYDFTNAVSSQPSLDPAVSAYLEIGTSSVALDSELENYYAFHVDRISQENPRGPIIISEYLVFRQIMINKSEELFTQYNLFSSSVIDAQKAWFQSAASIDHEHAAYTFQDFVELRNKTSKACRFLTRVWDNLLSTSEDINVAMFYAVNDLNVDALSLIPIADRLNILNTLSQGRITTSLPILGNLDVEGLVLRIFYSVETESIENCTLFLSGLTNPKTAISNSHSGSNPNTDSGQETLFQYLYEQFEDFSLNTENWKLLMDSCYAIWKKSFYSLFDESQTQFESESALIQEDYSEYFEYSSILNEENLISPPVIHYTSRSEFGYHIDDYTFEFSGINNIVSIKTEKELNPLFNVKLDADQYLWVHTRLSHHIFQPVYVLHSDDNPLETAVKMPKNPTKVSINGTDHPNYQMIPLFYLKFVDDLGDNEDLQTTLGYVFDVVTILTGVGNLIKLRHLANLSKLRVLLSGASIAEAAVLSVRFGVTVIEISSGFANLMIRYAWNNCIDAPEGSFKYEFKKWVEAAELVSFGSDIVSTIAFRKASRILDKKIKDVDELQDALDPDKIDLQNFRSYNENYNGIDYTGLQLIDEGGPLKQLTDISFESAWLFSKLDETAAGSILKGKIQNSLDQNELTDYLDDLLTDETLLNRWVTQPVEDYDGLIESWQILNTHKIAQKRSIEQLQTLKRIIEKADLDDRVNLIDDLKNDVDFVTVRLYSPDEDIDVIVDTVENGPLAIQSAFDRVVEKTKQGVRKSKTAKSWRNGRKFEKLIYDDLKLGDASEYLPNISTRFSEIFAALGQNKNLDDYDLYENVQLFYPGDKIRNNKGQLVDRYFTPDIFAVKRNESGKIIDTVIIDVKLQETTKLSRNQGKAIAGDGAKFQIKTEGRLLIKGKNNETADLTLTDFIGFNHDNKRNEWIKLYDGINGETYQGTSEINWMTKI